MIKFPEDIKTYNLKQHDGFLGMLHYNMRSNPPFSVQFEEKEPHHFFSNQVLPKPLQIIQSECKAFNHNNSFLHVRKQRTFRVFGSEDYAFKTKEDVKNIKFIGAQIFLKTKSSIHAIDSTLSQSIYWKCIDIDVSETTKEVFILNRMRIEIVNGNCFPIRCLHPRKILVLDNPREVCVFTYNDGYHIDIRQKKVIKRIFSSSDPIHDVQRQKNRILVKTNYGMSVVQDLSYGLYNTAGLFDGKRYRMNSVYDEVMLNMSNKFMFFDIDNLCRRENVSYDIENFVGATAYKNKFHFFKSNGILSIDQNGNRDFLPRKIDYSLLKDFQNPFFGKKNVNMEEADIIKYDYWGNDCDIKCELYDQIMNEINQEQIIENEKMLPTPVFSQVKKKQSRNDGF